MRQYNSNKVEVSWLGLDFAEGLATGTFITPARTTQSWTYKTQRSGKVIRSFNADRSLTISVLVNQASKLHQQLIEKANLDASNNDQVGPMIIKEISSGRQTTFKNAFIQSIPDEPFDMEDSDITWVFIAEDVAYLNPADDANVVGN